MAKILKKFASNAVLMSLAITFSSAHSNAIANPKTQTTGKLDTYQFIGNSFSNKFHKPSCEFARKMNLKHVRLLKKSDIARQKNYKPCNWCYPSWTKSVSSKVLKKNKTDREADSKTRVSQLEPLKKQR